MVAGVSGGLHHAQAAPRADRDLMPVGGLYHPIGINGLQSAVERSQARPMDSRCARDQPVRLGEMADAPRVNDHPRAREFVDQPPGGAAVVQMDMREDDPGEVIGADPCLSDRLEGGGRRGLCPRVDQCRTLPFDEKRGGNAGLASEEGVEHLDAGHIEHGGKHPIPAGPGGYPVAVRPGAIALARTAGRLSRRLGRGGGTSLPGNLLLRLEPDAAGQLARDLPSGSVMVSATNGKTTTTRLIGAILDDAGHRVVMNTAGANLMSGVTTALMERGEADIGLFEVDEAALPEATSQIAPRALLLMNLFRDQLDRYGELEALAGIWAEMVGRLGPRTTLVVNADDPAVADLGSDRPGRITFGIDDVPGDRALPHAADSTRCRQCSAELAYSAVTIAHMGHWSCPNCAATRPTPDVRATSVTLDGLNGQKLTIEAPEGVIEANLALPGLHNAYNATAAAALALSLDIPPEVIGPALSARAAAFGRGEVVPIDGRDLVLLLAKNPAGANENVHTLLLDAEPLSLLILLNDRAADGRDISWIWDVDYELLLPHIDQLIVSGDRAWDLGLRFRYAGLASERITVIPEIGGALDAAVASTPEGSRLHVLPTYTALLDVRARLRRRGVVDAFWQDD